MKRLSVFLVIIALLGTIIFICMQKKPANGKANDVLCRLESILEDGDIIFRLGDRPWSMIIKDIATNKKEYSHVGIIKRKKDVTVISAETLNFDGKDGVVDESLEKFIYVAQSVGIYRLQSSERNRISRIAGEYIGKPFDWEFDIKDDSRIYCSELLYVVLGRIRPDIILNTVYIKEIKKDVIPLDVCEETRILKK
jgi:uncharacterized protein YycO